MIALDHRGERKAVIASSDGELSGGRRRVGVRKIKVSVIGNAAQQFALAHAAQSVPADVRRFYIRGKRANLLGEKFEAGFAGCFLARSEHRLEVKKNAENRFA